MNSCTNSVAMAIVKRGFVVWTFFVLLLLSFTVNLHSFLPPSCSSSSSTLHTIRNELDISKLTTLEVEDYVKKQKEKRNGKAAIVLSIGATEQHGPTGLLGTDRDWSVNRKSCGIASRLWCYDWSRRRVKSTRKTKAKIHQAYVVNNCVTMYDLCVL